MSATPSIEYWSPKSTGLIPERFIERCARTAYRSEEKMTEDSYKNLLPRIVIKNMDHSICEHTGDVVQAYDLTSEGLLSLLEINPMIAWKKADPGYKLLINGRHVMEFAMSNNKFGHAIVSSLKEHYPNLVGGFDLTPNVNYYGHGPAHEYPYDPRFILATYFIKGVSRVTETQWVRHRRMSYTVMSGRGVDLREQAFVIPPDYGSEGGTRDAYYVCKELVQAVFDTYESFRNTHKISRQDSRYILPQGTATEMVVTASLEWWEYFFKLRAFKPAQWEIRDLARMINKDLFDRYPKFITKLEEENDTGTN